MEILGLNCGIFWVISRQMWRAELQINLRIWCVYFNLPTRECPVFNVGFGSV